MWKHWLGVSLIFLLSVACDSSGELNDSKEIPSIVSMMEIDLKVLEEEISNLASTAELLFEHHNEVISKADRQRFQVKSGMANSAPNADPDFSTLFISTLAKDDRAVTDLIFLTESLDPAFKSIVNNYPVVSQVYFNSPLQMNRLYPPWDVETMVEPDTDLTGYNFYYEADEAHNPNKGPVWIKDIYLDPVGRGWMISLIHPVYHKDQLVMVLGFDITVNDILEVYLNRFDNQLVIIDETGMLVAGKAKAIEALSLPPLTNHTYIQTITSNNFRIQDFNLFKSKSKEVRKMASHFILVRENEFKFVEGLTNFKVKGHKMNRLNWYVLDLQL